MSISTQPNEMLDMILNQTGIPLAQRIRLRAVSHRFRDTLEEGLQQENSLAIRVVNPSDMKELKRDNSKVQPNDLILSVSHFTEKKAIALIGRLFPGLTELAINSNSHTAWRNATELLGHFARTLTSLKVDGYLMNLPTRRALFRRLGKSINSIVTLTSLHLEHESVLEFDNLSFGNILVPHLADTLSRLERFTFANPILGNQATLIATSLSSRCTHLRLNLGYSVTTFPVLQEATNLTHLHLNYSHNSLLQFVSQLPQLTSLTLHDYNWPNLDSVLQKICPLFQVTAVTFKKIYFDRPLEAPASKAFTFPSIKRLTLKLGSIHYIYYYEFNIALGQFNALDYLQTLALWFPNLSTCDLHVPEEYREEILAIHHSDLPFTVKLLDNLETTF